MRATLTFTADTEEILGDAASMLNRRTESYNEFNTHREAARIASKLEYADVQQLPNILNDIAYLRTQLAKLDFALEDTMKIVGGYYQAITLPPEEQIVPEEPTTNDEV